MGNSSVTSEEMQQSYENYIVNQTCQLFVVVGHARTGSSYLLAGLYSSKYIRMYPEIFAGHAREIGKDFEKIMYRLFRQQKRRFKAVGFKLFYFHLNDDEWKKFLLFKAFKVIHLIRVNRLRTIVSLEIANKTNQWKSSQDIQSKLLDKSILIDTSNLIGRLDQIHDYEVLTRERFKQRYILEVVYEELVGKPRQTFQRIGDYLDIEDIDPTKITLTRQNPESLELLIRNYDEVYRVLENTRYFNYLNE